MWNLWWNEGMWAPERRDRLARDISPKGEAERNRLARSFREGGL